jgi:hypothetical protein
MNNKELKLLSEALTNFENEILLSLNLHKISGGFAVADMFNFDDDYIDIELKSGIQSDCENNVITEQFKMNRKTFEIIY